MSDDVEVIYIGFLLGHGGDAVQMLELAMETAARGRRVRIVVPALETTRGFAEHCRERGLAVERSPLIQADASGVRQSLTDMLRLFARHRAPIIHLHTGNDCLPRLAILAMDLLRLPRAFVTVQSPYATLDPAEPRARQWAAATARRFDHVFCPSRHSRDTQIGYGVAPDRVQTIHNSVDVGRFSGGDARAARAALNLGPDHPLIVFSSRLEPQKRPLDAVAAFRAVAADFPDVHLVFVGRGSLENDLRAAAVATGLSERVHLMGHQSNVPDWLAAATVWHLPTESENFSLAVLEALAAGCPIVSTVCPGNDEVLVDEWNSLTTAVGDVAAQAGALRRLLASARLREQLQGGARQTAGEYAVERMADQYAQHYARLIGAHAGHSAAVART